MQSEINLPQAQSAFISCALCYRTIRQLLRCVPSFLVLYLYAGLHVGRWPVYRRIVHKRSENEFHFSSERSSA